MYGLDCDGKDGTLHNLASTLHHMTASAGKMQNALHLIVESVLQELSTSFSIYVQGYSANFHPKSLRSCRDIDLYHIQGVP